MRGQISLRPQKSVACILERDDKVVKDRRRLEAELTRQQAQLDRMQTDTMEDAKTVTDYLNHVHALVSEVHSKQDVDETGKQPEGMRRSTTLGEDARKGDKRAQVHSADQCQIGAS